MIFTLQRYILRELLRVFILATVGLTLILSLGGIVQPVQQYGVGPRQVFHILLYFMPITLTFVLPMSALFASALTYGRFASDNEFDACRASGISLATVVYPGLALAILVSIANLILSFHVMPYFVHLAEKSLKADAKQILFRNIERRGYYMLPPDERYLIYADYADMKNDTLYGIVVVQAEQQGIRKIITTDMARIHFDPHDKFNEVQLDAYKPRQMGAAGDVWWQIGTVSLKYEFGSLLGDEVKFKKIDEMKRIGADLMLFDPIAKLARQTYAQLATELLAQDINETLSAAAAGSYEFRGESRLVRVAAAGCVLQGEVTAALSGPVIVDEYDGRSGAFLRTLRCERAEVHVEENAMRPKVSLDLYNARVEATGQLIVRYIVRDLALAEPLQQSLGRGSLLQVVAPEGTSAILKAPPSRALTSLQEALSRKIEMTQIDIKAEMNSRLAFGIGCVPMILIGIGLGIVNRGGHMLSAFGASCVPAAVLIVAIISGKHLTQNVGSEGVSGIMIMWAGLAFLTLVAALVYARLLRT